MKYKGVALIMFAAICWGISGGIGDILISKGWDPIVISFYRGAVAWLCFILWFLFHPRLNWITSIRFHIWAILAGIGVAGNFTFYFLSIEAASVAVAVTLMYTAPVFVLLISFILGVERSTWFKWACIVVVLMGIILLTGAYDMESISTSFFGTAAGITAGLSYVLFIFGFKNASAIGKPQATLMSAFFAFSFILFLIMDKEQAAHVLQSGDIGWFILLGILGAGVSFILYVVGIRRTAPTTASMVAMVEPVTASLFGILLLGNPLAAMELLGMVLILFTTTLFSVKQSTEKAQEAAKKA
ncbi:DMT family transporter [Isachenkonia alkalipeptolytica]|uniref:DMT family transporter n=1 Tax=Isachenkonia alkalipeptolytica TaxID=2565777 RepID=A0AA43XJC3_9CLOT|nr:DMT family transporter [Isachenkonia alkalipeptolytica]NBG87797.1 DMT family transporter [Isachenkonia alkalipeptolytica]